MNITVLTYQISTAYTGYPNWTVGRTINVVMDDSTHTFSAVEIRESDGTVVETVTTGPPIIYIPGGGAFVTTPQPFYGYCLTGNLYKIAALGTFPYAQWILFINSASCNISPVCDLEISNEVVVVPTSGPGDADGSFTVTATSSNPGIRYSLDPDFDYTTGGSTSGTFSGLYAGTYTVYAKDSVGCFDSLDVIVRISTEYAVKYRMEYDTVNGLTSRVDILERRYAGSVSEICSGATPFTLTYPEVDRYTPFIASNAVLQFFSETEDQFEDLFTDDDRKFQVKFYKYISGSWRLKWFGYIIPAFYNAPFYRSNNNIIEFTASDQIGNLKQEDFVDFNGNNFRGTIDQLTLIREILKKTGIELNIRSADNLYETTMDVTVDADPLPQAKVDTRIFYTKQVPKKCNYALEHLVKVKSGLQLFQSDGYWWLRRSEMGVGSLDYREFTIDGVFVTSGVFDPVVDRIHHTATGGVTWVQSSQRKLYDQNYGSFLLTHILGFDDNFIDEGAFEEEDIIDIGNGNKGIKNWNVQINQAGLRTGLEYVENGDSRGAFFADFDNVSDDQVDNVLYSVEIPIVNNTYGSNNKLKFSFQYNAVPFYVYPWVRIGWMVRFINTSDSSEQYLIETPFSTGWGYTSEPTINDIYIDKFNEFQKLEIMPSMPTRSDFDGTVSISFFFHNHDGKDFSSLGDLKAVATDDDATIIGKRYIVHEFDVVDSKDKMYFYELEENVDVESAPDVLRPDDFHSFTNPRVWRMKGVYLLQNSLVNKFMFDNVKLSFIPYNPLTSRNFSPPEYADYYNDSNSYNKNKYEEEFILGDLPDMVNSLNLYRGWLRKLDETPSVFWKRRGVDEQKKILNIALEDRIAQWRDPIERIESNLLQKGVFLSFINAIDDGGKRYLLTGYKMDDKKNIVSVMMDRTAVGEDGEPPVGLGAYDPVQYSEAYKIS